MDEIEKGKEILKHFDAICELCGVPGLSTALAPLASLPEDMAENINNLVVTGMASTIEAAFKTMEVRMKSPEVQAKMAELLKGKDKKIPPLP